MADSAHQQFDTANIGPADSSNLSQPRSQHETQRTSYDIPTAFGNIDELTDSIPVQNPHEAPLHHVQTREDRMSLDRGFGGTRGLALSKSQSRASRASRVSRLSHEQQYDIPDSYANLDEVVTTSPVQNPDEDPISQHRSLEEERGREHEYQRQRRESTAGQGILADEEKAEQEVKVSRFATELYTVSYLIFFSFLGTLARLGLQAITFYPGAPVVFSELWANFGGSVFMGFLSEDRMLFKEEWGTPTYDQILQKVRLQGRDEESGSSGEIIDVQAAKKAHTAIKKTIPLYIGLATGFCGCFTSFSSFIRDVFLALSNDAPSPLYHPTDLVGSGASTTSTVHRNGGYSFMAIMAVIIITTTACLSGLFIGAHLAIALERFMPTFPFAITRRFSDRAAVLLAWGCWLGAILLAIFPPDRHSRSSSDEVWRGRAVFALVFAPLGCLARFYASLRLNGKIASFPLGTFVVNIAGTAILGMCFDIQRVPLGGVIGCQVLQGVQDGFCGCLTTVSTWVSELSSLRRRNAYRYGAVSVAVALACLVIICGSMRWTKGFSEIKCLH
ncbi:CrcB-like protein-domain-containing protein [Xylogone sp. PMI_703]|nr:CrcB-like protein-domain-containing protein [Xylogone sp. PMI_703]